MKVPLFVELCAGLASVSGVLEHGSTWKPPVSRMGRKTGYAGAILRVMGLRPRQKAERYLWAEADGDVAALLAAYTQPEKMRAIAAIIRSWIPCPYGPHEVDPSCPRCKGTGRWDARDLWEVLRREKRAGLWEGGSGADTAAWSYLAWTHHEAGNLRGGFVDPENGGRYGAARFDVAAKYDRAALPWPPVLIAQDAAVDVGSVAGWAWTNAGIWSNSFTGEFRDLHPAAQAHLGPTTCAKYAAQYGVNERGWPRSPAGTSREEIAARFSCSVWPPVHLTPAADLPVPPLPSGTVVYMDPPYAGTTGYKHALDRAAVIEIARRWHDAGARVYISEAEPIAALGWHHVEITSERKGQARTFGNTPEWLTCSRPPAWTPPIQGGLFR